MFDAEKQNEKINTDSGVQSTPKIKDREIVVNSMPEKFRFDRGGHSSAKNTGLLILVGGTFLIIVSLASLYFFVLKSDSSAVVKNETTINTEKTTSKPAEKKTEPVVPEAEMVATTSGDLSIGEDMATSTATTTDEQLASSKITQEAEDVDKDGLSDKEELIFGSNSNLSDSDGDGYSDFSEVSNLYNPAGNGKLENSLVITKYENNTFGYKLIYPTAWSFGKVGGDDSVVFTSDDNQFVQIISQPNESGVSIEAWFNEQQSSATPVPSFRKIFTDSWQGIVSEDGLVVYITDLGQENIFVVAYSSGVVDSLDYRNIFNLIVKSFFVEK